MPYAYVVEDHRDTANCLSQWLRLFNYEVRIALGPLAAIEALSGRVPDVIFLDIHMHGMDGVELIERIRALDHRKDVPIVMVTGTVDCAVVGAALAAGADDVLYKPTDVAIVVATVTKCVERRRHQDT